MYSAGLCMWTEVTQWVCVCVCVQGIKPYLFTEGVCLANTSWLPCSWQTDRRPQSVYCFRMVEIVGTWKRCGAACVWFMRRVCLISIINDNTAEGRKMHLLWKQHTLKWSFKKEQCSKVQQPFSAAHTAFTMGKTLSKLSLCPGFMSFCQKR